MAFVFDIFQGLLAFIFLASGMMKITGAKMQVETFQHLGLPQWFRFLSGIIVLTGVVGLIIGFWEEQLVPFAALGLAIVMFGAVLSHIRVKDSIKDMVPATVLMLLTLLLFSVHIL